MKNDAIIIYAKWPELNKTKTRIAEETTPEFARDLSMACLDDVVSHIAFSTVYDAYFGVNTEEESYKFKEKYDMPSIITTHDSIAYGENEQSSRMFSAFSKLFKHHNKIVLVPIDVPGLLKEDIINAFSELNQYEQVIGPEYNGGVYMIGVRKPIKKGLFRNVRWGTRHSFADLISNCDSNTKVLGLKSDLNSTNDLLREREKIMSDCPSIMQLLEKTRYYDTNPKYSDLGGQIGDC